MFPCLRMSKTTTTENPKAGQRYQQGQAVAAPQLVFPQAAGQEREAEGWLSAGRDAKIASNFCNAETIAVM